MTNVSVTYGTNPPLVKIDVGVREPILIWEKGEALSLLLQLMEVYKKAWPDS